MPAGQIMIMFILQGKPETTTAYSKWVLTTTQESSNSNIWIRNQGLSLKTKVTSTLEMTWFKTQRAKSSLQVMISGKSTYWIGNPKDHSRVSINSEILICTLIRRFDWTKLMLRLLMILRLMKNRRKAMPLSKAKTSDITSPRQTYLEFRFKLPWILTNSLASLIVVWQRRTPLRNCL